MLMQSLDNAPGHVTNKKKRRLQFRSSAESSSQSECRDEPDRRNFRSLAPPLLIPTFDVRNHFFLYQGYHLLHLSYMLGLIFRIARAVFAESRRRARPPALSRSGSGASAVRMSSTRCLPGCEIRPRPMNVTYPLVARGSVSKAGAVIPLAPPQ